MKRETSLILLGAVAFFLFYKQNGGAIRTAPTRTLSVSPTELGQLVIPPPETYIEEPVIEQAQPEPTMEEVQEQLGITGLTETVGSLADSVNELLGKIPTLTRGIVSSVAGRILPRGGGRLPYYIEPF